MNNGTIKGFTRRRQDGWDLVARRPIAKIWSKHKKRRGIMTLVDQLNERAHTAARAAGLTSYDHLHPTKGYKVKPV